MKNYDLHKESSYLIYCNVNNLHVWAISKMLPQDRFEWGKDNFIFHEKIMLDYDPGNDKEYIIEVDARYPKEIHKLYSDLLFLPKSMKLDKC